MYYFDFSTLYDLNPFFSRVYYSYFTLFYLKAAIINVLLKLKRLYFSYFALFININHILYLKIIINERNEEKLTSLLNYNYCYGHILLKYSQIGIILSVKRGV